MNGTPKPELRAAILELFATGLSFAQIAAQLGVSKSAVSGHVCRARNSMVTRVVPALSTGERGGLFDTRRADRRLRRFSWQEEA